MSRSDSRRELLAEATRSLERWGAGRDWLGPDPYDALNGSRVPPLPTAFARRAAIQLVKRSPVNLRRPLGIAPRHNSATIALLLSAYARRGTVAAEGRAERVRWCVEMLRHLCISGPSGASWGYHFDVETRFFFYDAQTPNAIATSFAGLALLDAHALGGEAAEGTLELAESAGEFTLGSLTRTEGPGGAYFGYFPGDRTPIHNANLLACGLLSQLALHTGREDFLQAARSGVGYALAHQRRDGSWPYAEGQVGDWVDGYHTGYVLDSLLRCHPALDDSAVLDAWRRGIDFYERRLFDPDGAPRFTAESRWPIDGICVAQAIETFARGGLIEPELLEASWRSFDFAQRRMRRRDGAYRFQRGPWWINPVPHVRWVQAPMLNAFSVLAAAEEAPS